MSFSNLSGSFLLAFLSVAFLTSCADRRIHTVKIESEANQIIGVLGENGIRAKKREVGEGERKTYEILVNDDDEVAAAIQLMEDHCLGRPDPPEPQGGPVIIPVEVERAREQRRLKMSIEAQLRKLPGATCVDVIFVPPQDRALAINPYVSTASVLISYKTPTFPFGKEEIANLVAGSVPALQPDKVEVVLAPKPLRPMPENKVVYNFTRIALVSGIGLATVLAFVSMVFVLRKKRRPDAAEEAAEQAPHDEEIAADPVLLQQNYELDDDDDEDGSLP